MDYTIYVGKTKALISCAVTVQLFCAIVFAYAKSRFYHDAVHISIDVCLLTTLYYMFDGSMSLVGCSVGMIKVKRKQ